MEMEVAMALMETVVEDEEEQYERLVEVFKYKRVANKVRPVEKTLPEEYRIQRQNTWTPLLQLRSYCIHHQSLWEGSTTCRSGMRPMMLTQLDSFRSGKRRSYTTSFKYTKTHLPGTKRRRGLSKSLTLVW